MDAPKRLTQKGYRPRLIEERLDTLMRAFGCVEINGPKWCGKTWTALSRSASVSRLDEPAQRAAAEVDPSLALIGDAPHLVDEWQEVPEVWGCRPGVSWTRAATNGDTFAHGLDRAQKRGAQPCSSFRHG